MKALLLCTIALAAATAPAEAQWQRARDSSLQWSRDGSPNLEAPTPRVNGIPDLSGVWAADGEPLPPGVESIEGDLHFPRHMINIAADIPPDAVPLQPWAADLLKQRQGVEAPGAFCKPTGVPYINAIVLPYKIVQTPRLILVLYEENTVFRQIFLDGRKPVEDPEPRYLGYSTGRWEGDELVVDTVGFVKDGWLDGMGHPHSERLHVIERFRRPVAGRLEIETTIDDPGAYTAKLTYTVKATLVPEDDLLEYFCSQNEKDSQHYR